MYMYIYIYTFNTSWLKPNVLEKRNPRKMTFHKFFHMSQQAGCVRYKQMWADPHWTSIHPQTEAEAKQ